MKFDEKIDIWINFYSRSKELYIKSNNFCPIKSKSIGEVCKDWKVRGDVLSRSAITPAVGDKHEFRR
jgi:hypothetical protein